MNYSNEAVKTNWRMANKTEDPDIALLRAIAQGDTDAMDRLYSQHGPGLLSYLCSLLGNQQWAEEVLQEVMLAAWQASGRFRGESRVYTWLLSITRNRAINALKRDKSLSDQPFDEETLVIPEKSEITIKHNDQMDKLRIALSKLPVEQRETLELVFFHGLSNRETASLLHIPTGTVKSRLFRAKARLRELLAEKE